MRDYSSVVVSGSFLSLESSQGTRNLALAKIDSLNLRNQIDLSDEV